MANHFKLLDLTTDPTNTIATNWSICVICQQETGENLVIPTERKGQHNDSGYETLAYNIIEF